MGSWKEMTPTCVELAERLARGEYERAPFWVRLAVRLHLVHCGLCDKYARQLGLLGEAFRRRGAEPSEADALRRRLLDRLR